MAAEAETMFLTGLLLIFPFFWVINGEFITGAININYGTFEKVIRNHKAVLVRFDDAYPYGDKHDEFKKLAVAAITQPDLLIADYGINDDSGRDDEEEQDRHRRRGFGGMGGMYSDEEFPPYSGSGSGGFSGSGSGMDDDYPDDANYTEEIKDDVDDKNVINLDDAEKDAEDEGVENEDDYASGSGSGSGYSGSSGDYTDSEEKDDDQIDADMESEKTRIIQEDDAEDMETNRLFAQGMGINKDDWPVFVLYLNHQKRNLTYEGEVTLDDMKAWITKESGLWLGLPFCMERFDEMVGAFLRLENEDDMMVAVKQAEGIADDLDDINERESAKMYITYMNKVIEKGKDFIVTELERVKKLRYGQVSENKKEQLRNRYYMLTSFFTRLPKQKVEL